MGDLISPFKLLIVVQEYRTTDHKIKGKLCHFGKEEFIRHNLTNYYWKKIDDINIEELKDKIVFILKKEGFVFFPKIDYKYITHFGNLTDFAVNFKYIE